ncbi:MAG: segregation/condensation protein A [Pirellulaceae bacterium]|nr:segregation/condensation protein A [Planctomycetales bacterium]MCA9211059.1 segregation/condensation protein A [Planctomycetales bacterium]MCA9220843.1 segregation/condensation protein A [Planctomycetales bacterium]
MSTFRVQLDSFRGPLDLLLYLVRKHEVDVADIPIAVIADQYLEYLTVLQELDVDAVGEFLEMASTLVEMKSRLVLPHGDEEPPEIQDPRDELVTRLLDYKKYRDAASMLEEQSREWQQRYARLSVDLSPQRVDPSDQPIQEVELWDLVSAFGRIMRDNQVVQSESITFDDTPIHVYMKRIHERLMEDDRVCFSEMFALGMHKSAMIGVFLAVLELCRHHGVTTDQSDEHGEIWIMRGDQFIQQLDVSGADDYSTRKIDPNSLAYKPR